LAYQAPVARAGISGRNATHGAAGFTVETAQNRNGAEKKASDSPCNALIQVRS